MEAGEGVPPGWDLTLEIEPLPSLGVAQSGIPGRPRALWVPRVYSTDLVPILSPGPPAWKGLFCLLNPELALPRIACSRALPQPWGHRWSVTPSTCPTPCFLSMVFRPSLLSTHPPQIGMWVSSLLPSFHQPQPEVSGRDASSLSPATDRVQTSLSPAHPAMP